MIAAAGLTLLGSGTVPGRGTGAGRTPGPFHPWRSMPATTQSGMPVPPAVARAEHLGGRLAARASGPGPVDSMARVAAHEELFRKRQAAASGEALDFRSKIENARQFGRRLRSSGDPELFHSVRPPEPAGLRGTRRGSDNPRRPDSRPAARVRSRKERNRVAIRLLNTWLHEDAKVESDTWELLKSALDRDRLSGRRLWI